MPLEHRAGSTAVTNDPQTPALPCGSKTLPDALRHWAAVTPEQPALTFLSFAGGRSVPTSVTYGELARRVSAVADSLIGRTTRDQVVAVLLDQGIDYITSFLACLTAGRVCVPLYAPDLRRTDQRLRTVLAHSDACVLVHDLDDEERLLDLLPAEASSSAVLLDVRTLDDGGSHPDPLGDRNPDATAYLQYTSGSTRTPAGVMVSHSNLAAGMHQIRKSVPVGVGGPLVSWLPFFHDMGLVLTVGALLQSGGHGIYLSPLAFVQRPVRWLRAMSDYRASLTIVPNFGLDLAVQRVAPDDRDGLDLSALRALCNGSEPIRHASLEAFTQAYRTYGFAHESHVAGYGLAETTLMVTAAHLDSAPTALRLSRVDMAARVVSVVPPDQVSSVDSAVVVSCGPPMDQEVRIVNPESDGSLGPLPPDQIGEIWVSGPNVCLGYHLNPELTEQTFGRRLAGHPGTWVRTGDLGFLYDGEVFVVGRWKDLLIVGGKNHYPADIEATILEAVPHLRQGAVAAFAHEDGGAERLVVVIELEPRLRRGLDVEAIEARVRGGIARNHEVAVHDVVVVRPGAIPRTTSGKLQRRACAQRYAAGLVERFDAGPSSRATSSGGRTP